MRQHAIPLILDWRTRAKIQNSIQIEISISNYSVFALPSAARTKRSEPIMPHYMQSVVAQQIYMS